MLRILDQFQIQAINYALPSILYIIRGWMNLQVYLDFWLWDYKLLSNTLVWTFLLEFEADEIERQLNVMNDSSMFIIKNTLQVACLRPGATNSHRTGYKVSKALLVFAVCEKMWLLVCDHILEKEFGIKEIGSHILMMAVRPKWWMNHWSI